jgi:cytochrome c oxidase cbb3-type subunit 2
MPPYAFLADKTLQYDDIEQRLRTERLVGVPYTDEMISNSRSHLTAQANPGVDYDAEDALTAAYNAASGREGTVEVRDFDGDPARLTEMDALVAYLQMTGTLVDFSTYEASDLSNRR